MKKNYQSEYLLRRELGYFKESKHILDLGCGEGEFLRLDRQRIIGLDTNRKSIQKCKKNNLKGVFGSVTKIPFGNNSFDGVHCSHVIEHLNPSDAHKMLKEVARVLKNSGIFVLSTPILWEGFYNDFTHIKPYNPESIMRYLVNEAHEKSLSDINGKFRRIDFYWRFKQLPLPSKIGNLLSNYLYQFGFHSFGKNAYTLVLKKIK